MGAVLGAPIAAVAATGAEETSAAAVEQVVTRGCPSPEIASTTATTIREQFRASFAAGAVTPPSTDATTVICETS